MARSNRSTVDALNAALAAPAARPVLPGETLPPAPPAPHTPAPTLPPVKHKLTDREMMSFLGQAVRVHDGMSDSQILESIKCNFSAEVCPAEYNTPHGKRVSNETNIWYRSDNGNQLGTFGNRREPIQPSDYVAGFRSFCEASDKQITLDAIGQANGGKTLFLVASLGRVVTPYAEENYVGEVTSSRLIITDYYGESLRPKAILWQEELICCNGMTKQVQVEKIKLSHFGKTDADMVHKIIEAAVADSKCYKQLQDKLIHTRITAGKAENVIRSFFRQGEKETNPVAANKIVSIWRDSLIGGDFPTRQDNAWRVLQAVTQYTSHERIGKADAALRSQLDGSRSRMNQQFLTHLCEAIAV